MSLSRGRIATPRSTAGIKERIPNKRVSELRRSAPFLSSFFSLRRPRPEATRLLEHILNMFPLYEEVDERGPRCPFNASRKRTADTTWVQCYF